MAVAACGPFRLFAKAGEGQYTLGMRFFSLLLSLFCAALPQNARAGCFDFTHPIETVFEPPAALAPGEGDRAVPGIEEASGTFRNGVHWAAVRGEVPVSVARVVEAMKGQEPRKGDGNMLIMPLADPMFLIRQKIKFSLKVVFVKIEWIEDWAYSLLAGTKEKPERVFVGYEKTSGTSHMEHFCGSMSITHKNDQTAEVYIYEEVKATRRSREDNLNNVRATLRNLQTKSS